MHNLNYLDKIHQAFKKKHKKVKRTLIIRGLLIHSIINMKTNIFNN